MKPLLPLVCSALLLSGCPDSKLPKVPPNVPAPKASISVHAPVLAGLLPEMSGNTDTTTDTTTGTPPSRTGRVI